MESSTHTVKTSSESAQIDLQEQIGNNELLALSSTKISDKLTLNLYKNKSDGKLYIGLDHFHFKTEEVMFTEESFKKMIEAFQAQNT